MVHIYTDGSCWPNPGPGGWAFVVTLYGRIDLVTYGAESQTTNNRMEFKAALQALKYLKENRIKYAAIYTDSMFLLKSMKHWRFRWKENNWKRRLKDGKTQQIKNLDLVRDLDTLANELRIQWRYVKGHSGDAFNELADFYANPKNQSVTSTLRLRDACVTSTSRLHDVNQELLQPHEIFTQIKSSAENRLNC